MKLTYTAVAASLLSVLSCSAMAANVDIYGKANVTVQSSDAGEGSYTEVNSNASRLGFKGTQTLDNGLEVLFKAEYQIDLDGDSDSNFKSRSQYIGLKGDFGSVLVGKNDTALKKSQGKIDLFNDLNGDIKKLWKGENRLGDSVTYLSPSFNGFKAHVTYIAEDSVDADAGVSAAVGYGDVKLKKSSFFASVAVDSEVDGYDTVRVSAQTKLAGVTFGGIYHMQESVGGTSELDGLMFSAKYSVNGIDLKAQVQTANTDDLSDENKDYDKVGYSFGADYKLAKNVKVFAFYTALDHDGEEYTVTNDDESVDVLTKNDESYFGTGLEYKF